MFAVRMENLGNAGPIGVEASPFHALMADRMAKEGVLRRLPGGGYLVAVREADLPALVGLRSDSAGRIDLRPCDGIHLAEIGVFADVLDVEMRCTLLSFPADFMPEEPAAPAAGAAPAPGPRPAAEAPAAPAGIDALMRDLDRAMGEGLGAAPRDAVAAQIARDLPEIERILRRAGVGT